MTDTPTDTAWAFDMWCPIDNHLIARGRRHVCLGDPSEHKRVDDEYSGVTNRPKKADND